MSTLELAIEIAAHAHAGQYDKAGQPYILHPLRLMFSVEGADERIVAVLHDVVEDTAVTFFDLEAAAFSKVVVEAVRALTKVPGETRLDAAQRAAKNPIARTVKLADVSDNMNLSRISNPTHRDLERLKEYEQVKSLLISSAKACKPMTA